MSEEYLLPELNLRWRGAHFAGFHVHPFHNYRAENNFRSTWASISLGQWRFFFLDFVLSWRRKNVTRGLFSVGWRRWSGRGFYIECYFRSRSDCPLLVLSLKRKIFVQRYIYGEVTELTNITFFLPLSWVKKKSALSEKNSQVSFCISW